MSEPPHFYYLFSTLVQGTLLPFMHFLYKHIASTSQVAKERSDDLGHNLHISSRNVLLLELDNFILVENFTVWRFYSRKGYWTTLCAYQQSCLESVGQEPGLW